MTSSHPNDAGSSELDTYSDGSGVFTSCGRVWPGGSRSSDGCSRGGVGTPCGDAGDADGRGSSHDAAAGKRSASTASSGAESSSRQRIADADALKRFPTAPSAALATDRKQGASKLSRGAAASTARA